MVSEGFWEHKRDGLLGFTVGLVGKLFIFSFFTFQVKLGFTYNNVSITLLL